MDYKCFGLILMFCVSVAAQSRQIVDFPAQPVGVTVGYRHVIPCGISGCSQAVSWEHNGQQVYNSIEGIKNNNYDIEGDHNANPKHYDLVIKSATRDMAGVYTCGCLPYQNDVSVLVFEEPVLTATSEGQLLAGQEESLRCEVLYGADGVKPDDERAFQLNIQDEGGVQITDTNTDEWEVLDTTTPLTYRRFINSSIIVLDWQDHGQEYACVITMTDYSENITESFTVLHTASNITLSPFDAEMNYYKTEQITAQYTSHPEAKRWVWSREVNALWEVIDDDDDQERTIAIGNWPRETRIKVDILNEFDHDQDGTLTEQNGTQIFDLNIYECCRTGDATHVTYSALVTSLFVFISALLLER